MGLVAKKLNLALSPALCITYYYIPLASTGRGKGKLIILRLYRLQTEDLYLCAGTLSEKETRWNNFCLIKYHQ